MAEPRIGRQFGFAGLMALLSGLMMLGGCAQSTGGESPIATPEEPPRAMPWEWWRDLSMVASVPASDRVAMRSSHCPSGCGLDRHSEGDSRFLRLRGNGEGVIFSADGPGAVTRIWMVMGDGTSEPLDPSISIRVRIDGRKRPVIDLPLPELFGGTTAPFLAPVVADRASSGGGHVSYLPIPFRDGCEVSLVGAENAKIWFQVTARLLSEPAGVRSFTGAEPPDGLGSMLGPAGGDPWRGGPYPVVAGTAGLAPGGSQLIASLDGPDMINGLLLRAPRKHWHRLGLRFTFDDGEPWLIPASDLFGLVDTDGGPTLSLLVGADSDTDLYCYFPMPFFDHATVEIMRRPVEGPRRVKVEYALRRAGSPPPEDAGYFGVQTRRHRKSTPGEDLSVLELEGAGVWVGLAARMSASDGKSWAFLEGDERVFIDGGDVPEWHGTGIEDFFNGGFYFRDAAGHPTAFSTAMAGAPSIHRSIPTVVMYRLLLGDAVVFSDGIRAGLETGPTGELGVRAKTVAYYYTARAPVASQPTPPED